MHCRCLPLGVLPLVSGEDGQDDAAHVLGLGILELAAVKCSPTKGDNPGINPVFYLLQHEFNFGPDRCTVTLLRILQKCSTKMLFHVELINEASGAYFCTDVSRIILRTEAHLGISEVVKLRVE